MINLVNTNGSIKSRCWRCNTTNQNYEIISTSSTYNASHYRDKAIYAKHIVKRKDGLKRTLTTPELSERFTNVTTLQQDKY